MFDNITLKIDDLPKNYRLNEKVETSCKTDTNSYKYKLGNMILFRNYERLIIMGSLPKYLNGENITPLSRESVKRCIEKLEQDIGINLKDAIVCSAEFGTSIITKEKPFEYLNLFGNTKKLTRVEYSKWTGIETVIYTSKTGAFEFIGYDKIKEMLDKKQEIPSLFDGSNVLRLEYKIRRKRGIEAKFKGGLFAYSLFDKNVYRRFQELFLDKYKSIEKLGKLVYIDKSKKITPAILQKLQAEQYRQCFPKDCRYFIQRINEAGKTTPESLERIRAENNKTGRSISVSEQSGLIKELNALVYERAMFGT